LLVDRFNFEIADFLVRSQDVFIAQNAGRPLLNSLKKLQSKIPSRSSECAMCAVHCLSGTDIDAIVAALSMLISMRLEAVAVHPDQLAALFGLEGIREKVVRLIAISPPTAVSPQLLSLLAVEGQREWENLALMAVCRCKEGAAALVEHHQEWLLRDGVSQRVQLQMLLAGLTLEGGRTSLLALDGVPKLFAKLISAKDFEMIALIGPMLKRCPLDAAFVERMIASGSVVWLIDVTNEVNKEEVYMSAYSIVEALVPVKWLDDFGAYIRSTRTHLQASTPIAHAAANYLMVLSMQPLAIPLLQRASFRDFLTDRLPGFEPDVAKVVQQVILAIEKR
jgi:hypothetical protein